MSRQATGPGKRGSRKIGRHARKAANRNGSGHPSLMRSRIAAPHLGKGIYLAVAERKVVQQERAA